MVEPRPAKATVQFIDEYCQWYQTLFPEVRSFEAFKQLHLGLISQLKRKTLPAIAEVAGLDNAQALHHFLTESPWQTSAFRQQRLRLILQTIGKREIVLVIDDTGDRKKGHHTDYVKRQYIGNLGKIENGIVAVTAYGVVDNITLPLLFEVYKPKERLKPDDVYRTKPEIAAEMMRELQAMGFCFKLVLADSLYGESGSSFIDLRSWILSWRYGAIMPSGCHVSKRFAAIVGASLSAPLAMVKLSSATSERSSMVSGVLSNFGS